MELLTRQYGPNPAGRKLTIQEMDDNLLYLNGSDILTTSNIVYVSPNGDDTNPGSLTSPLQSITAARDLASTGDTVYVLSGTYTYNNTDAAGNPYNNKMDELVNLWKDGVTYFFAPGSKIVFANQTTTGQDMYLFKPYSSVSFENCKVYGKLEFLATSIGADTSGGNTFFFQGSEVGGVTALGYEFNCELLSITSTVGGLDLNRSNNTTSQAIVNISLERFVSNYAGVGQTGAGTLIAYRGSSNMLYNINVGYIETSYAYPIMLRCTNADSKLNVNINKVFQSSVSAQGVIIDQQNTNKNIAINLDLCYFYSNIITCLQGSDIVNLTGNFYQLSTSSSSYLLYYWNSGSSTLNFKGNISVLSPNANIIYNGVSTHIVNFDGNINIISATPMIGTIVSNANGTCNFTGKVNGSFSGVVASSTGASSVTNVTGLNLIGATGSQLVYNNTSANAKTSFIGCKINLSNSTALISNAAGSIYLLNSSIKNSGTGTVSTSNATVGQLQVLNSSLIVSSSSEVLTISGTTPVCTANSSTNKTNTITALTGSFTVLNGIDIN